MPRSVVFASLVLLSLAAPSCQARGGEPPPGIDTLAWLAGHWRGAGGTTMKPTTTEEWWTAPAGGVMLGTHREVRAGRKTWFEFLRIEETPEGLVFHASPGGAPSTPFPAVEVGPRTVVFENPAHDFPVRIRYGTSADGDSFAVSAEGRTEDGNRYSAWIWLRVKDADR